MQTPNIASVVIAEPAVPTETVKELAQLENFAVTQGTEIKTLKTNLATGKLKKGKKEGKAE